MAAASLRHAAIRGGSFVAGRQLASLAIGLAGTIALTRLLGPTGYGRFAAALALTTYAGSVAQLGVNAWLIRRPAGSEQPSDAPTARALLLASGLAVAALAALALPAVERWLGGAGVRGLGYALLAGLPLQLLWLVPLAALERELRFRDIALTELWGMTLMFAVSVLLAALGWGPKSMVIGWWMQQLWLVVRLQGLIGTPLAFAVDAATARRALGYGLPYASSIWTWQLKDLVNPLIVGRWLGVEGVAQVALAIRLVDAAAFVKHAAWRLSLPALARLQGEPPRLAAAVRDGMRLQLLTVGPALLALAVVGPSVIPWVFGREWLGVRTLLPFVAGGVLANAMFNLHSSALYALGRNLSVTAFHLVFVGLFAVAASALVPRLGSSGYGLAELLAMPAYAVVFAAFRGAVGRSAASPELLLGACLVTATVASAWHPAFCVTALIPVLSPAVRAGARESVAQVRSALLTPRAS